MADNFNIEVSNPDGAYQIGGEFKWPDAPITIVEMDHERQTCALKWYDDQGRGRYARNVPISYLEQHFAEHHEN